MQTKVTAAPFLIQLLVNVPDKATGDGTGTWGCVNQVGDPKEILGSWFDSGQS